MDHEPDDDSEAYRDPNAGYRGPPTLGDLSRMAARKIGEQLEDFEASDPDNEYRGPASIGTMLGTALLVLLGVGAIFFILLLFVVVCSGPGTCSL
jgi:hypothetical protein